MDNDHMCFYGIGPEIDPATGKRTGRIVVLEIVIMRGWKKVYRTPKKWSWQPDGDWNERQVRQMRESGLLVRSGCAADIRIGMPAGLNKSGKVDILPPKRERIDWPVPTYANGVHV